MPDLNAEYMPDADVRVQGFQGTNVVRVRIDGADAVVALTTRAGQLVILHAGAEPERVTLEGVGARHRVWAMAPLSINGETLFAIASTRMSGFRHSSVTLSVHDRSGGQRAQYTAEFPAVEHVTALIDIIDLTHDGVPEIVLGLSLQSYKQQERGVTFKPEGSSIIVLDVNAQPLAAKSARGMINFVRAVAGAAQGEHATIYYGDWATARAMRFQP